MYLVLKTKTLAYKINTAYDTKHFHKSHIAFQNIKMTINLLINGKVFLNIQKHSSVNEVNKSIENTLVSK